MTPSATPSPAPARVRAVIWGVHLDAASSALAHLSGGHWPGADTFTVIAAGIEITPAPCPLDLDDPRALRHRHVKGTWAWVLYPAGEGEHPPIDGTKPVSL